MNIDYDAEVRRIARALSEIAHTLEAVDQATARVTRVLALTREVVPYARCALLSLGGSDDVELITVPALADDERELLRARLRAVLHALVSVEDPFVPGEPSAQLTLPVLGLDRVIGVVRVTAPPDTPHEAKHVRLLSVVAAQIGAYLAMIRLHEEQRRAALDLTAASEFQQRLVGIVSHDLRNPLAVITTVAASLLPRAEDQRQARALERALRNAQKATRIIGDLIDVTQARIRGELAIVRRSADLRGLIEEIIEDEQSTHADRQIVLDDQVGAPLVGHWDPDRLSQLATNLIANALQYGDPAQPLTVGLAAQEGDAILTVHNHGTPIPAELVSHIFDPFRRGTREHRSGLGLGLFIVEQIARSHGGLASVTSTAGEGTRFTVRIPITEAPEQPAPSLPVHTPAQVRPLVMVIDDDLEIRVGMAELLESAGYRVTMAGNGAEALALLHEGLRPRLVLVDLNMPVMDGEEFCAACRDHPALSSIPLLIISADAAAAVKAARFGAGVLSKPVKLDQLVEAVAGLSA